MLSSAFSYIYEMSVYNIFASFSSVVTQMYWCKVVIYIRNVAGHSDVF